MTNHFSLFLWFVLVSEFRIFVSPFPFFVCFSPFLPFPSIPWVFGQNHNIWAVCCRGTEWRHFSLKRSSFPVQPRLHPVRQQILIKSFQQAVERSMLMCGVGVRSPPVSLCFWSRCGGCWWLLGADRRPPPSRCPQLLFDPFEQSLASSNPSGPWWNQCTHH